MKTKTKWVTAIITEEQAYAIDYACEQYSCNKSELIRILISPFVFAQDNSDVPIKENDWKMFRKFMDECARIQKAL